MHALVEIYDLTTDTLVYNTTMNDTEVSQYYSSIYTDKVMTGIDE